MNKNYILLLLLTFCQWKISAQSYTDLSCKIATPLNNASLQTNTTVNISVFVKNNGMLNVSSTDSIALYFIIDGDTVKQAASSGTEKFKAYTNWNIAPGDSISIVYPAIFDASFSGLSLDFCVSAFPLNRSIPFRDSITANNLDCVQIAIGDGTTDIYENSLSKELLLYPNPVSDRLNIVFAPERPYMASLYSLQGAKVKEWESAGQQSFVNMSGLIPGSYILKLTDLKAMKSITQIIMKD